MALAVGNPHKREATFRDILTEAERRGLEVDLFLANSDRHVGGMVMNIGHTYVWLKRAVEDFDADTVTQYRNIASIHLVSPQGVIRDLDQ